MKTYIVQLDNHDDVISTRDKISWSKANRVLLVWPRRGRVLERSIDLLLLKRHTQHAGAQLAVVTGDNQVKTNAVELGIPVFSHVDEAQQVSWRRDRRRRRVLRRRSPQTDAYMLRQQRYALSASEKIPGKIRLAVFLIGLLSVIAMVFVFLPEAQIELNPTRTAQRLVIPMWASPAVPAASPSGGIPAVEMTVVVEGRDEGPVTGQSLVADRPASGEVQLSNLTDQPVVVPEGSIVIASSVNPVRFFTRREVRVPAGPGESTTVAIEAAEPGTAGNLSRGRIRAMEGALGLQLVVNNLQATRGGSERISPSPTAQDYQILREQLLAALKETAEAEIAGQVGEGQQLLAGTLQVKEVIEETGEPEQNQPGHRLLLSMRVQFIALVVAEKDIRDVAQAALEANREERFSAVPGTLVVTFSSTPRLDAPPSNTDERSPTARWEMRVERLLEDVPPEASIARSVQGLSIVKANDRLQARISLDEPPGIRVWPSWWGRMPFLPSRIQVVKP